MKTVGFFYRATWPRVGFTQYRNGSCWLFVGLDGASNRFLCFGHPPHGGEPEQAKARAQDDEDSHPHRYWGVSEENKGEY